ncbi:MAG: hypothetical protein AAF458_10870 [Pseudomonadota bacterium]
MNQALGLFKPFIGIGLLQVAPQALPASRFLLGLTLTGYLGVLLIAYGMRYGFAATLIAAVAEAGMLAAFVAILLTISGKPERQLQTLCALYGCGAVLGFLLLPVNAWFLNAVESDTVTGLHTLAWLFLAAWEILIRTHVFRHALERGWFNAMVYSVLYFWLGFRIMPALLEALGGMDPPAS